jgi:hypothetical protein
MKKKSSALSRYIMGADLLEHFFFDMERFDSINMEA